jgi:hypothetical protein
MMANKQKNQPARQFGVYYMHDTRAINWQRFSSRAGFSSSLLNAIAIACWHISRDDYYPKAVVVDRWEMKIVRVIHRTSTGISIQEK